METPSAPTCIGNEHVQGAEEVLRGELIGWVGHDLCLVWICWRNQEQPTPLISVLQELLSFAEEQQSVVIKTPAMGHLCEDCG